MQERTPTNMKNTKQSDSGKRVRFILLYFGQFGLFSTESRFKAFTELFSGFMNKRKKEIEYSREKANIEVLFSRHKLIKVSILVKYINILRLHNYRYGK